MDTIDRLKKIFEHHTLSSKHVDNLIKLSIERGVLLDTQHTDIGSEDCIKGINNELELAFMYMATYIICLEDGDKGNFDKIPNRMRSIIRAYNSIIKLEDSIKS